MRDAKWPCEFLGRCAHCLDNAYLDGGPCFDRFTGWKLDASDCLIEKVRKAEPELQKSASKS
jgi:hypothetical protein